MDVRDDFFSEIQRFFEEVTAFANMFMGGGVMPMPSAADTKEPHEDALETDTEYVLTLELPGVAGDDIIVNARKREIEVEVYDKTENTLAFTKAYPTQHNIKPKKLAITYKNGVLEVRAPKK